VTAGDQTLMTAILRDISERKAMEHALQEARAELERKVAERTIELQLSNKQLLHEVNERTRMERELRRANEELESQNKQLQEEACWLKKCWKRWCIAAHWLSAASGFMYRH